MVINSVRITNSGYILCRSSFYSSSDGIDNTKEYRFVKGINKMIGEIDSGIWAVSYLMSMYKNNDDFILFDPVNIEVNGELTIIEDFLEYSCYMDRSYELFSSDKSIKEIIETKLAESNMNLSSDNICQLFMIDPSRFNRPLSEVGNERFKGMAAIGYVYGKQVFCFPWLSHERFSGFHNHMTSLLEVLKSLDLMVILPVGQPYGQHTKC